MSRVGKHRLLAVVAVLVIAAAAGAWAWADTHTGIDGVSVGKALRDPVRTEEAVKPPMPVGAQWGLMFAEMGNTTTRPIVIQRVVLRGAGVGSVIVQVGAAQAQPRLTTPSGIFRSDPPAMFFEGGCHVATLAPLHGFVLQARTNARIFVGLRTARPGRFFIKVQDVYYTENGHTYHQPLAVGFRGHVVAGSEPVRRPRYEQRCLSHTHALPLG